MTSITNNETSTTAERGKLRMTWLVFGPLILAVLLQFGLGTLTQSLPNIEPIVVASYVQAPAGHDDAALRALMWEASKPVLIHLTLIALAILICWLAIRRWGWRRIWPVFTGLWVVVWVGVSLVLVARYVNRVDMVALPPAPVTVISAVPYPSSESGPGGARTWLQPTSADSSDGVPWRVNIEGADFHAMPAGTRVTLQRARGALWGVYVTGSDAPRPQPGQIPEQSDDPS